jgi:hypothetical protein
MIREFIEYAESHGNEIKVMRHVQVEKPKEVSVKA